MLPGALLLFIPVDWFGCSCAPNSYRGCGDQLQGIGRTEWLQSNLPALLQIVMIDVVLEGDNSVIVGLAASRVAPELRRRVILWGIAGAVVLRVAFAAVATTLLDIVGLTLAGGLLLSWVCWKMYWELTHGGQKRVGAHGIMLATGQAAQRPMSFRAAVTQIIVADVSMSLDSVLAVAGAAKGESTVLAIGLGVSIVLMAIAANAIANLLARYAWIAWIGWFVILCVALEMTFIGSREIACAAWSDVWCAPDITTLIRKLLAL
jgi:YjbE family integral membrane protein